MWGRGCACSPVFTIAVYVKKRKSQSASRSFSLAIVFQLVITFLDLLAFNEESVHANGAFVRTAWLTSFISNNDKMERGK